MDAEEIEFELVERLHADSFSEVHRARQPGDGGHVVVRLLNLAGTTEEGRAAWNEVFDALEAVDCDGVTRVLASGVSQGTPFVVSALPRGSSLLRAGGGRRLQAAEVAYIVRQVALTLKEVGRPHGDLHPQHVWVSYAEELPWPRVEISNFQIAPLRARLGQTVFFESGADCRPPGAEQELARDASALDVHALGAIAYWGFTGTWPRARSVPFAEPVLQRHPGACNVALAHLVDRMLADNPSARPSLETVIDLLRSDADTIIDPAGGVSHDSAQSRAPEENRAALQRTHPMLIASQVNRPRRRRRRRMPPPWWFLVTAFMAGALVGLGILLRWLISG